MLKVLAGGAHAASFQNWNNKVETCASFGDLADLYYRMNQQGKQPQKQFEPWLEPLRAHIQNEIFSLPEAYDRYTARSWAASHCMDNIEPMIRAAKASGHID